MTGYPFSIISTSILAKKLIFQHFQVQHCYSCIPADICYFSRLLQRFVVVVTNSQHIRKLTRKQIFAFLQISGKVFMEIDESDSKMKCFPGIILTMSEIHYLILFAEILQTSGPDYSGIQLS